MSKLGYKDSSTIAGPLGTLGSGWDGPSGSPNSLSGVTVIFPYAPRDREREVVVDASESEKGVNDWDER